MGLETRDDAETTKNDINRKIARTVRAATVNTCCRLLIPSSRPERFGVDRFQGSCRDSRQIIEDLVTVAVFFH